MNDPGVRPRCEYIHSHLRCEAQPMFQPTSGAWSLRSRNIATACKRPDPTRCVPSRRQTPQRVHGAPGLIFVQNGPRGWLRKNSPSRPPTSVLDDSKLWRSVESVVYTFHISHFRGGAPHAEGVNSYKEQCEGAKRWDRHQSRRAREGDRRRAYLPPGLPPPGPGS